VCMQLLSSMRTVSHGAMWPSRRSALTAAIRVWLGPSNSGCTDGLPVNDRCPATRGHRQGARLPEKGEPRERVSFKPILAIPPCGG
jgi:hypothetical protein